MLNVFDLTRRSLNTRLLKSGKSVDDLESQMQPDSKLREEDIAIIEKEVNKKKQKRHKAKKEGSMISPLATSRRDT